MSDCKPISCKEFETYLRVKKFIERNGYKEADLINMVRARDTPTPKSRYGSKVILKESNQLSFFQLRITS